MTRLWGIVLVFLGACSFGVLSTIVKKAYAAGYTTGDVTGVQALVGLLLLWACYVISRAAGGSSRATYRRNTAAWKILLCGCITGTGSLFYYKCVQHLPASIAIIMLMQYIWISTLIDWACYKIRPSRTQVGCIAVILCGTVLATGMIGKHEGGIAPLGIFFGMLAALTYALFLLINGRVGNDYPPLQKSALMVTGAFVTICVVSRPEFLTSPDTLLPLLRYGVPLGLFGMVIPPLFFAVGIPRTGVALAAILSAAELPTAVAMSRWVLHENVSLIQWAGVAVILLAIIQANRQKPTPPMR